MLGISGDIGVPVERLLEAENPWTGCSLGRFRGTGILGCIMVGVFMVLLASAADFKPKIHKYSQLITGLDKHKFSA